MPYNVNIRKVKE